jgi:hypothetical protein
MTVKKDILPTLDPVAFVAALVLAPLLVALLFFWVLLIPVFAVIIGGLPYLIFGTPVLLWMVTRYPMQASPFAVAGLASLLAFIGTLAVADRLAPTPLSDAGMVLLLGGIPFSAGWFIAFALLYRRFWRPVLPLMS